MKPLILITVSLLFTLVLLEIVARVFHLGSGGFWEPYPLYGWRNIPNARGWESCYGECSVFVEINSNGLRDYEIPFEKPTGIRRILFLGDSMTAGMQVPLESTFVKILEQDLNTLSSPDWQTINAGINAFGTDNELIFYQLEGMNYEPDIVVLGVYLANDIYNNHRDLEVRLSGVGHKPYFTLNESGELELHNFPVENSDTLGIRFATFLKRYFQLPRFVAEVVNLRKEIPPVLRPLVELATGQRGSQKDTAPEGPRTSAVTICNADYAPAIEEAWDITKAIIRELRGEVEKSGASLVVLVIPAKPQLFPPKEGESWYCEQPNIELAGFLEAEGIPYLDLLMPFRQQQLEGGGALYYNGDFHLNQTGHALAGSLLGEYFLSQNIDN